MKDPCGARGRARRGFSGWLAAAAATVSLTVVGACAGDDDAEPGEAPLGWGGQIEARAERYWSSAGMDSAQRWTVADAPAFAALPDSLDAGSGRRGRRDISHGALLPDGRVVLLYRQLTPDPVLLHFLDPATGAESRIPAPRDDDGRALNWSFFRMAVSDGGLVLGGGNERRGRSGGLDLWYADLSGTFQRPPSLAGVDGTLVGVLPDGSLVANESCRGPNAAGELLLCSTVAVRAGDPAHIVFTGGLLIDPGRPGNSPAGLAHFHFTTIVVAGELIGVAPTERPELVAVDRSGDVHLKIEWDGGDRSLPPEARDYMGVERFPAVADLKLGTDGLLYVERPTLQGTGAQDTGGPRGSEWLVFSQEGELVARLNVPRGLRVLAFGNGAVLSVARADGEVRVYEVRPTTPSLA